MLNKEIHPFIKEMVETQKPKIENLSDLERRYYRFGLALLGYLIREDFFDIPKLPEERFSQEGLFYTVEYYDSEQLWTIDNTRIILVLWEVKNGGSHCPLNLSLQVNDEKNYKLVLNDNVGTGQRSMRWTILECENGAFYTEMPDFKDLRLSQLVNYTSRKMRDKEKQA